MSANVEIIFATARELQAVDRPGYLDEACAGDQELRAQVEALLAADADAGSFLKTVHDPDATITMTRNDRDSKVPTEQAGQLIGRYKLLQQIGEGGFGTVWMAEQKIPVKRRIALKIIKLGMDTKLIIARFEAERQALAMMDHPNIAKVFDAGSTESGRPYFVMELVRGIPILEYCDTEKLDTKSRLKLFMLVCNAIQHAHQKGIIHRDIKPSNVLVTLHDGEPVPKVIDFGIAKATNQELTQKTLYTEYNQMIGTPAYMSPEQAEMSGLDIDTRSDIYSLGVLLYELLTGTTPFDHKELMNRGFAEMMRVIREETPHKPSTRLSTLGDSATRTAEQRHTDLKKLGTVLRGDLDWIVMRCLEKNRIRRYDTATGLAADINRHLNNEPVEAGPPSAAYKMRKFVRRNKGMVISGSAVAAALLVGVAGTTWQWSEGRKTNILLLEQFAYAKSSLSSIAELADEHGYQIPGGKLTVPGMGSVQILKTTPSGTSGESKVHFENQNGEPDRGVMGILQLQGIAKEAIMSLAETKSALEKKNTKLIEQTNAAEWSSYTANLALAQMAMDNGNWPEARARIAACPESKRGWEWEFLSNKAESVVAEFRGWGARRPNPDKQHILVTANRTAQVYDLKGNPVGPSITTAGSDDISPYGTVLSSRYSLDGSHFALRSAKKGMKSLRLQVFNHQGIPVGKPIQHGPFGSRYAISSDGRFVATTAGRELQIWDAAGNPVSPVIDQHADITSVRFGPNGKYLLASSKDHTARLWTIKGDPVGGAMQHEGKISAQYFSPDGSRILTVSSDKTARWWDLLGNPIGEQMVHEEGVRAAGLDPEQSFVVTETDDAIYVFDWTGTRISRTAHYGSSGRITGQLSIPVDWSRKLIYVSPHYTKTVARTFLGVETGVSLWHNRGAYEGAVLNSDGQRILLWSLAGELIIRDKTGTRISKSLQGSRVLGAGFFSDPAYIWVNEPWGRDEMESYSVRHADLRDGDRKIYRHDFARLKPVLLTGEDTSKIQRVQMLHNLSEVLRRLAPDATASTTHPDNSRIVTAAADNTVRFWDPETEKELAAIPMDAGVTNLTFTPDGTRLVIELDDGSARIFDTRSAEEQAADIQRRWAERVPAGEYLDTIMAGPTPTANLMATIEADDSLIPIRRLAAAEVLQERFADMRHQADRAFDEITKDQTDQATVLAAAEAIDLPPRVKELGGV